MDGSHLRELSPREWADSFIDRAVEAIGPTSETRTMRVGQQRVSIVFGDRTMLEAFAPALSHALGDGEHAADAEILVWCSMASGAYPPRVPWEWFHVDARGGVAGLDSRDLRGWDGRDDARLVLWHAERRMAVAWWRDQADVREWERGAPLRTALHFVLAESESRLIHAGAVGTAEGGVLLAGRGGSGKSTTVAACLQAGLDTAGDDYVVAELTGSGLRVHSLYSTLKTTHALAPRDRSQPDEGRRVSFVGTDAPGRLLLSMPVRGIVVCQVGTEARSVLEPAAPVDALRAVASSTVMQLPHRPEEVQAIARLVRSVPAYRLRLGRDRGVPVLQALISGREE